MIINKFMIVIVKKYERDENSYNKIQGEIVNKIHITEYYEILYRKI